MEGLADCILASTFGTSAEGPFGKCYRDIRKKYNTHIRIENIMRRWIPTILKYSLVMFVLFWLIAGQLSIFVFLYSLFEPQMAFLPTLGTEIVGIVLIGTTVSTVGIGYYRFGSLMAILSKATIWFRDSDEENETLVEGRVLENDFAWRMRYRTGGLISVVRRECPRCGQEVVQRQLPNYLVFGPNTAFNPSSESRAAASKAWHDVTGKEKAEDRKETMALTCPDCNVSAPGDKEILEGRDAAVSRFEKHIEKLKRSSPSGSIDSYRDGMSTDGINEPSPADVWDKYVQSADADDILRIHELPPKTEQESGNSDFEVVKR